jgi:hypothetical protein
MFASDKIGSTMTVTMTEKEGKAWFGVVPPDLSVESRIRGRDWLYNYLLGFYRDDKSATGWNNIVFPNVGMPHVLWELSGINKLVETEYEDHEKATAAAIAIKGCPPSSRCRAQVRRAAVGARRPRLMTACNTSRSWRISSTTWTTWPSRSRTSESISASSCCCSSACCSCSPTPEARILERPALAPNTRMRVRDAFRGMHP